MAKAKARRAGGAMQAGFGGRSLDLYPTVHPPFRMRTRDRARYITVGLLAAGLSTFAALGATPTERGTYWLAIVGALVGCLGAFGMRRPGMPDFTWGAGAKWGWLVGTTVPVVAAITQGQSEGGVGEALGGALVVAGFSAFGLGLLLQALASRAPQMPAAPNVVPRGGDTESPSLGAVRHERDCPWCAEPILAHAKFCKHCKRDVEPVAERVAPATPESGAASIGGAAAVPDPAGQRRRPAALRTEKPAARRNGAAVIVAGLVLVMVVVGARWLVARNSTTLAPENGAGLAASPEARRQMLDRALKRQIRRVVSDPAVRRQLGDVSPDEAFALGQRLAGRAGLARLGGDELAAYARAMSRGYDNLPGESCARLVRGALAPDDTAAILAAMMRGAAEGDSAEIERFVRATVHVVVGAIHGDPVPRVNAADFEVARERLFSSLPSATADHITGVLSTPSNATGLEACYALSTLYARSADLPEPHRSNMLRGLLQ